MNCAMGNGYLKEVEMSDIDCKSVIAAYKTLSAEQDREISRLKAEIERLKCCGSCTSYDVVTGVGGVCTYILETTVPVDMDALCDNFEPRKSEAK